MNELASTTGQQVQDWPPRPTGEVFPEVLDTILVAQLLLYDRRGMTPERARRNVRGLVKNAGLPVLGKVGSTLMYRKADVFAWLGGRNTDVDGGDTGVSMANA